MLNIHMATALCNVTQSLVLLQTSQQARCKESFVTTEQAVTRLKHGKSRQRPIDISLNPTSACEIHGRGVEKQGVISRDPGNAPVLSRLLVRL